MAPIRQADAGALRPMRDRVSPASHTCPAKSSVAPILPCAAGSQGAFTPRTGSAIQGRLRGAPAVPPPVSVSCGLCFGHIKGPRWGALLLRCGVGWERVGVWGVRSTGRGSQRLRLDFGLSLLRPPR